jgi:mRNA-degrading endonuclease RelE of RelBE toxin-antitoxin system
MSWKIEVKPNAEKQYLKLDNTTRRRIKKALLELEQAENPLFHHGVKQLMGKLEGIILCGSEIGESSSLRTELKR